MSGGGEEGGWWKMLQALHCSMLSCAGVCVILCRRGRMMHFLGDPRLEVDGLKFGVMLMCAGVGGCVLVIEGWGFGFFLFGRSSGGGWLALWLALMRWLDSI